jgi:hypothetical protein
MSHQRATAMYIQPVCIAADLALCPAVSLADLTCSGATGQLAALSSPDTWTLPLATGGTQPARSGEMSPQPSDMSSCAWLLLAAAGGQCRSWQ